MKKRVTKLALTLGLAVALAAPMLHPRPAHAILGVGDICANCSEEVGEILRQAETIAQMVKEYEQIAHQIEIMEQNLKHLPDFLKDHPIEGMKKLVSQHSLC